jgi:hypothetical protein
MVFKFLQLDNHGASMVVDAGWFVPSTLAPVAVVYV